MKRAGAAAIAVAVTALVGLGAYKYYAWRDSLRPFANEVREFRRVDVVARYCPFSVDEISRALGRPVAPRSVLLGPMEGPRLVHCSFVTGGAGSDDLTLGYFQRIDARATLIANRQMVERSGGSVTEEGGVQTYTWGGRATAEYVEGRFTAQWSWRIPSELTAEQAQQALRSLPMRAAPTFSAMDVWSSGRQPVVQGGGIGRE